VEYRQLGKDGPRISRVGLGAATFGREIDLQTSFEILGYAVQQGITLILLLPFMVREPPRSP
jgi:aryl-alcohol dehydrogenase-like predicted oxidoreductase